MTLADILKHIDETKIPPVHLWNPDFCGDIDMVIKKDGSWFYMGTPIGRERMVRLFSRILRREEDGQFLLVTPVEKVGITVEDAPFVTKFIDFLTDDAGRPAIAIETNVGDKILVDADHAIRVDYECPDSEPRPYVHIRSGLEARISRVHFYELVEKAEEKEGQLLVSSCGQDFSLGSLDGEGAS